MKENPGVAVGCPSQPTADLNNGEWKENYLQLLRQIA